ncbi:hypothetical protein BOX15_Mlig007210g1 [Macrostomum lignano]|uniref:Uncharacterized protein n=1 Tax=Macrostomum lignano TaxID=282301 RepID=A0A267EFI9_9PLAT|nr:hypothetical protein BOX15_Mlig007210g2 [Macrostomum lignano]PAA59797.1 hypothetical protein BOX15_Mlig007210g1 [Macrostomum lignano]
MCRNRSDCLSCLWTFLWLLVLILLAWPVAFLLFPIFLLLLPTKACCGPCAAFVDLLHQGVLLPLFCAVNAMDGTPMC